MSPSLRLEGASQALEHVTGRPWPPRQLAWGLGLLNLLFVALCAAWLVKAYRAEVHEIEAQAANTALLTERLASARFDALALGLSAAALQFERQIAQGGIDARTVWSIVDEQTAQMPEVQRLGVFDAHGDQVCGMPAARCPHLNVADRDFFQQMQQAPAAAVRLYGPHVSRLDGQRVLMLVRALRTPAGDFAGVTLMVLPLASLRSLVTLPHTGESGAVGLRDAQLRLLLRSPELSASAPNPDPAAVSDRLRAAVARAPDAGVYRAVTANDGVDRIVAYRRLANQPLYVLVGQGASEQLLGWRRDAMGLGGLVLLVALGSWALVHSVGQSFRRQAAAQRLHERAPCGYHTLDAAGRYLSINDTELQWLGCTREEVIGRLGPRDFFDEAGRACFAAHFPRLLAGQPVEGLAFDLIGRDGTRRHVMVSAHAEYDLSGHFQQSNSVMVDITARRQADALRAQADALEQQNEQLRELNRLKDDFVSNMSHELRTPLNGVLGLTTLLAQGHIQPGSQRFRDTLDKIQASGQHLLALIDAVLSHAQAEKGQLRFAPEALDLPQLLAQTVDMMASACAERQVHIDLLTDEGPAQVTTDALRLRQMVLNLLSNAVKFSHRGGVVELRSWTLSDTHWALSVHDHGIGIDTADLPRLFQRYVQLSSGPARAQGGSGLGLSLVRQIARAQGGDITVRSMPGEGSTFTLVLPRNLAAA